MGQARSLPCGEELCGYYEAALAYLDPRLPLEASLEEVVAAASRRQAELARRPLDSVRGELQELAEAVLFIQRSHPQVRAGLGRVEMGSQAGRAAGVKLLFEAEHSAPGSGVGFHPGSAGVPAHEAVVHAPLQATRPGKLAGAAARPPRGAADSARSRLGAVAGNVVLQPDTRTRPQTLELPQAGRRELALPEPQRLPEDLAWPVAAGLLIMLWQVWLAVFSGWVAARLCAWPAPGYGLDLSRIAVAGVVALAIAVAAGVALVVRAYRVAAHQLGMLVQLSALACALDLLAWWQAAKRWPGLVNYPGWGWVAVLVLGWLAAWAAAAVHDNRVRAQRKRSTPAKAQAQRR